MNKSEQNAFIDAYCQNGHAPIDNVRQFLELFESNQDIPYDEYYTSIADALGIWHLAIQYQLTKGLNNDE
jgi:hypothetical protein